jgi:adenylylsulfate kinase-like enzyme
MSQKVNKKGFAIRLTGLSGTGQTTIAEALAMRLRSEQITGTEFYRF